MNINKFGYTEIYFFKAKEKFKQNKNIFVSFYYHCLHSGRLVETPLYLLDKDSSSAKTCTTKAYKTFLNETGNEFSTLPTRRDQFTISYNNILTKHIFPHKIMQTFFYTDNRTKIPLEYLPQPKITDNQLVMNFN